MTAKSVLENLVVLVVGFALGVLMPDIYARDESRLNAINKALKAENADLQALVKRQEIELAELKTAIAKTKPKGARLTPAEAIFIAKQEAERQGCDLSDYKEPTAHYEAHKRWLVHFAGRVAIPGNHFAVSVDDETGMTQFHPGA